MDITRNHKQLQEHVFAQEVFKDAMPIYENVRVPGTASKVNAPRKRSLYQNEVYVIRVGFALSHLLIGCEQLSHVPLYLASFSPSKSMVKGKVTRYSHILLFMENYIIRIRSLYDRMLQLVNVVFRIWNPPDQVTHALIKHNLHVANSKLPGALQKLKKTIDRYREDRNKIVHRECFQEDDLRHIELLTISSDTCSDFREDLKFFSKVYVRDKALELKKTNSEVYSSIDDIFNLLLQQYQKQKVNDVKMYGDIKVDRDDI